MTSSKKNLRAVLILIFIFLTLSIFGQTAEIDRSHLKIQEQTDQIFDSLVNLRRDLHMYPEVSGNERRTSNKIIKYLKALGLEVKTNIGGYGVVGILKGSKPGKKIAWRADMDAMPSKAPDLVDFKSKNEGVRHICGHDVHTTVALGIANVLTHQKEDLEGTVYFVFQPSEENIKGALAMMDDGLFDIIEPEEMYAMHVTPFPAGTIATKPEEMFSDYKQLNLTFQKALDNETLIAFAKNQIKALENVASESKFWNMQNMGDPEVGIASPKSIYNNFTTVEKNNYTIAETEQEVKISAFLNFSDKKQRDSAIPKLKTQIKKSTYADKFIDAELVNVFPTLDNNAELVDASLELLSGIYGKDRVHRMYGVVADGRSDDFAFFQPEVPSVYFFMGGSNYEKGIIAQTHSPNFAVDESCIKTGVNLFSSLIVERLK
ncbi:amidohydrolase [Salegentibacter mishustinae]|uniref:M20 metallopeptidase family protein n=1 Tax=Salegentibacter mishustinae TaxID=270918 RepID=UPI001CE10DBA|nr:amidohydrolase [Salegentibacter mishustinae]UBZ07938.1 amidohydrolase [Salegentibacter mishustinae]